MRRKMMCAAVAAAMAGTLFAGCGGGAADSAGEASSAASASAVSEAAAESAAESTAESAEESASGSVTSQTAEAMSDKELIANLDDYLGDESMEGKKIGMTVQSLGNDFMISLTNALQAAVEAEGATIQIDPCDGDSNLQIEQIENYVTMGMDLVVAFPLNGEALVSAMDHAHEAGIPTMAFAMEIPTDTLTTIMKSAEEDEMGYAAAQMASNWIDETFPDAGDGEVKVLLLGASTSPEAVKRTEAMESIVDINSKVTLKRQDSTDWNDQDAGRSLTENEFMVDSEYDVVLAVNATTALGADSYLTSSDSPISDRSKAAIFAVDETDEIDQKILASETDESLIRGTFSLGSAEDLAATFMATVKPVLTKGTVVPRVAGTGTEVTLEYLKNKN